MPTYIITLSKDASDSDKNKIKDDIKSQGGSIEHEYTLINGFSANIPDHVISTLESHPHVENMERDQEVRTQ